MWSFIICMLYLYTRVSRSEVSDGLAQWEMHTIFIIKPEGKRPLRRHRGRWEDIIRMDHREMGWCGLDSSG
jgi:hypothetical protein